MPRSPRKFVIDPSEVGVFHCTSRCVRRAFLCGLDPLTQKNFEHRRQWIQDRLAFLAGRFAVDVLGFAVMSNHLHVILRNRPDLVAGWTDDEVARRWWQLFPLRRDDDGQPAEPQPWELSLVTGNAERLAQLRSRLSSIPWFMRCVAEPIARWANREDACTGRFWEGRYKCQPILDESALVACLAYVDLNPIRAGMAETPETSRFTSVYERIAALRASSLPVPQEEKAQAATAMPLDCSASNGVDPLPKSGAAGDDCRSTTPAASQPVNPDARGAWLSPFELSADGALQPAPPQRASNRGCLPMQFSEYLELLDWTGRQIRTDKRGAIPPALAPILDRLQLDSDHWMDLVSGFGRLFRRAAGRPEALRRESLKWGRRRTAGVATSERLFS